MTRRFNGKSFIDELAVRLWDTSSANIQRILGWANEIQDDLISEIPLDEYKFRLKKLLPLEQEIISLSVEKPSAPTTALASGGLLTEDSSYKAYVSFLIWDEDLRDYIESEIGPAGTERTATASDKTINLTDIPTFSGDTTVKPATIYRRIYLATKADGETSYGEPFFLEDITDNTTTTLSITSEPTSTRTPVSDCEIDQISSDSPFFLGSSRSLERIDMARLRSWNPSYSESNTPYYFDYVGTKKINLYPRLTSSATTSERTLVYHVHRRPHEIFYDVDCEIDLPIAAKKALYQGIVWKGYDFRDRDGVQTQLQNYEEMKKQLKNKLTRQRNRPGVVRDVMGDTQGYEV